MIDFLNRLFTLMSPVWAVSLAGAWAAAVVFLLRLVLKNRVPRQVLCLLWLVVFARLALPFSFQSPVSLVPAQVTEDIPARVEQFAGRIDPLPEGGQTVLSPDQLVDPGQTGPQTQTGVTAPSVPSTPRTFPLRAVVAGVWLAGTAVLLGYALVSCLRLRRKLFDAIRAEDGAWEHPGVGSPFMLGMIRPKIYIPVGVTGETRRFILCHERAHLDRGDHIVKPLCWLILAVHWFNPAAWAAFLLLSRDMEAACDERVLRELGEDVKADYSSTLLALATAGRFPAPSPLAFDEGDAGSRVKNVLRYHRPAVVAVAVGVVAVVIAAVCLLTSPASKKNDIAGKSYVYEKDGFGGTFAITIGDDGTFTYYEGSLSSYIGAGTWTLDGDTLRLQDTRTHYCFRVDGTDLVFLAESSSDFMYVDVADGERFSYDPEAPGLHIEPLGGVPSSPEPTHYDVTLHIKDNGVDRLDILGMDADVLEYANRKLYLRNPRFLGAPFDRAAVTGDAELRDGFVTVVLRWDWDDPQGGRGTGQTLFSVDLAGEALVSHTITYGPGADPNRRFLDLTDEQMLRAGLELGDLIRRAEAAKAEAVTEPQGGRQDIEGFFDCFARGDIEGMKQYCTEDCVSHFFQEDSVMGMKRARLLSAEWSERQKAYAVSVEPDPAPDGSLAGQETTTFFLPGMPDAAGNWRINGYFTG